MAAITSFAFSKWWSGAQAGVRSESALRASSALRILPKTAIFVGISPLHRAFFIPHWTAILVSPIGDDLIPGLLILILLY